MDMGNPVHKDVYDGGIARYGLVRMFTGNKMVLDLGCGTGFGTQMLDNAKKIVAIDCCEEAILLAKEKFQQKNTEYKTMNILDFKSEEQFDVVLGLEIIEHITQEEGKKFLYNVTKLMKETGYFFLTTPIKMRSRDPKHGSHKWEYSYQDLIILLEKFFIDIQELRILYAKQEDRTRIWYEWGSEDHISLFRGGAFICSGPVAQSGRALGP